MRSSGVVAAGWRANGALALGCLAEMMEPRESKLCGLSCNLSG